MMQELIKASPRPELPLIVSQFNAAPDNVSEVTDSIYMGPWLAATISQCDGLAQMMSYWTFSDVFEEHGIVVTVNDGKKTVIARFGDPILECAMF
jgi:xylan 1,4-beta-xylosidase